MTGDAKHTPEYLIELAAAGELDADGRRAVLERAASERGEADPLAPLARDDAETLARLPSERVAAEVARRASRTPRTWWPIPFLVAAGVAASLLLVAPARDRPTTASDEDGTRVKGRAPRLVVHRRTRSGAEVIAPGAPARPGDLLQLGYVAAPGFGVIVSIDGRGGVTRHWPLDGNVAGALTPGREVLLAESFKLDDAPGFERFFLVTAEQPFEVAAVVDAARALATRSDARDAALRPGSGLGEASVLVRKETR